jgi:hypothetical protein
LDNEKAKNASVAKQLDVRALPAFFILDPRASRSLRWVGGATVAQLDRMLDDGARAVAGAAQGAQTDGNAKPGEAAAADRALARADRLYGAGDYAGAAPMYREALRAAPRGWPQYSRAVESRLFALTSCDSSEAAAELARDTYPRRARTALRPTWLRGGLDAAPRSPPIIRARGAGEDARDRRAQGDRRLHTRGGRGRPLRRLRHARGRAQGREGRGRGAKGRRAVGGVPRRAGGAREDPGAAHGCSIRTACRPTSKWAHPSARSRMLEASERDFPTTTIPRRAWPSPTRAEALGPRRSPLPTARWPRPYGPRKLRLLRTRADLYAARGGATAARRTVEEAIATAESFPPGQRNESTIEGLKEELDQGWK